MPEATVIPHGAVMQSLMHSGCHRNLRRTGENMQKKNNSENNTKKSNNQQNKQNKQTKQRKTQAAQTKQAKRPASSKPRNGSAKKYRKTNELPLKIAFLGGLNEVGKNMTLYEYSAEKINAKSRIVSDADIS